MHKDVIALLGRLGLKERESRVYITCLLYKDGLFIYEIVRETNLVRSTVNLIVRRLVRRGFLSQVKIGRRLRYFGQSPESILFRQKQVVEDFEKIVPLLGQMGSDRKDMEILYFEGQEGFRQVQHDILLHLQFAKDDKRELLGFYSSADYMKIFPDAQKAFFSKRIKMGIPGRSIATAEAIKRPDWTSDSKSLRQVKYVPEKKFPFRMIFEIYGDNVMLYSPAPPVGGAVIRNNRIADSMRILFNLIWTLLPEK